MFSKNFDVIESENIWPNLWWNYVCFAIKRQREFYARHRVGSQAGMPKRTDPIRTGSNMLDKALNKPES